MQHVLYTWLKISKGISCQNEDAKSKYLQNIVPKSILRFHILWNLQYLIFKLIEGFVAKTVFLCKNWHLNCQNTNTLYIFPNFRSLSLTIIFSPIVMTCWIILPYFKNAMSDFKTGPLRCVEKNVHIQQK